MRLPVGLPDGFFIRGLNEAKRGGTQFIEPASQKLEGTSKNWRCVRLPGRLTPVRGR
jgi:hypothetical protein